MSYLSKLNSASHSRSSLPTFHHLTCNSKLGPLSFAFFLHMGLMAFSLEESGPITKIRRKLCTRSCTANDWDSKRPEHELKCGGKPGARIDGREGQPDNYVPEASSALVDDWKPPYCCRPRCSKSQREQLVQTSQL